MRILNIRFRNLNSLAGDWSIDLEAPEFESNGIFAITGPTGSGKSTILDAICLALYASTPRLSKVNSKEENDILTRHCGDCFAEVTFRTVHGKFRCCWSQHRAHKKPNGPLQDPKHELFDEEGRSLASGIKEVGKKVEELTGMDFTRFTQSTLLAQGSFAAFLLSKGDERAALLEKMTGTGIYSEISKYIFEQNKLEKSRLNELDTRLALCAVLSGEAETELRARSEALSAEISAQNAQELLLGQKLDTLRTIAALKQEHDSLLAEKTDLSSRNEAFQPSRQKLDIARRALLCSAACSTLLARRDDQKRDKAEAESLREKIEPLRTAVKEQEQVCTDAETALLREKEDQASLAETLKTVRALDIRLKAQAEDMARKTAACQKARISLEQAATEADDLEKKLFQSLLQKKESSVWLADHASDAALPQHIAAMRTTFAMMVQREVRQGERAKTLQDKQKELEAQIQALDEGRSAYSILAEEHGNLKQKIKGAERRKDELLQGRALPEWRAEKERSAGQIAHIQQALDSLTRRGELLAQCAELQKRSALLKEKIEGENRSLALMEQRQEELRQAREKLAEYIGLLERIRSYEEERLHLQDGTPCPLCGAVHHPFAEGHVPAVDEQKAQLQICDQKLYELTDELALCRSKLARLTSDQVHLIEILEEKEKDAARCKALLLDTLESLSVVSPRWLKEKDSFEDSGSEILAQSLTEARNVLLTSLASAENLITRVEEQEEALASLRGQMTTTQGKVEESAEKVRLIEQSCITLKVMMQSLADELEGEELQQEKVFTELRLRMIALSETISSMKEIPEALGRLNARSETFILKKEQDAALQQACIELEKERDLARQNKDLAETACQQTVEEEKASAETYARLDLERTKIFGDRDTDEAEIQTAERVQSQEKLCADCRSAYSLALKNSTDAEARLAILDKRIAERELQLKEDDRTLTPLLHENGFCSAEDCISSCLEPDERLHLENQERSLAEQAASLKARMTENKRKTSELTDIPSENEAELAASLGELKEKRAAQQEELGALREKLENNEVRKQESLQTLAQKAEQEKVCRRWADLNTLIGSSDGKAFRVYAQGLTLRVLLEHANRQLRAMTDRYQLVQAPRDPLSLSVIDHYQADIVRTSRNLSGGESFLVSLSLALGLARMASRNVRVDSVFLDEGFGTLDEDSLNMALDMLAGLRQQGKTIGIISHVQTIRERISVRIQVEPTGSGRSRLSGPGIRNG